MSEHDAKIVEAAESLVTNYSLSKLTALAAAIVAKREAETSKLLGNDEAVRIFEQPKDNKWLQMQAVLEACHARAALVADRALYAHGWESARPIVRHALTGKD